MKKQKNTISAYFRNIDRMILAVGVLSVVSAMIIGLYLLTGGFELRAFNVRLLSFRNPHKFIRFLIYCLGLLLALITARRTRKRPAELLRDGLFVSFILCLSIAGARLRHDTPVVHGDGLEYILQTQAIVLRRELKIDTVAALAYWNLTNPYGISLRPARPPSATLQESSQAGGRFGGLYPDQREDYRYYHYWMYSAAVAPLYWLLHQMDPSGSIEYAAFPLMNLFFLCFPLLLAWALYASWPLLSVCGLILFSPMVPYVDWQHTEMFVYGMTLSAFFFTRVTRFHACGPVLLGLAASQTLPVALFFPLHLADAWLYRRPQGWTAWFRFLVPYGIGSLLALSSLLYFYWHFGVLSVIQTIGLADLRYTSWMRCIDIFIHPMTGALWVFPACFLMVLSSIRKRSLWFVAVAFLSIASATWLACATDNFNSGQIGASRHAIWLLVPLWFMAMNGEWQIQSFSKSWRGALFVAGGVISLAIALHSGLQHMPHKNIDKFSVVGRAVPAAAELFRIFPYRGDPEILVENIVGRELHFRRGAFDGIYIWNIDEDLSLWVLSYRAVQRLTGFAWRQPVFPQSRVFPAQHTPFASTPMNLVYTLSSLDKIRFSDHPVMGPYILLRVKARVSQDDIQTNVPLYIRD